MLVQTECFFSKTVQLVNLDLLIREILINIYKGTGLWILYHQNRSNNERHTEEEILSLEESSSGEVQAIIDRMPIHGTVWVVVLTGVLIGNLNELTLKQMMEWTVSVYHQLI